MTAAGRVKVKTSPIHGRGVFALVDMAKGSIVDRGHLLVLPEHEPEEGSLIGQYVFEFSSRRNCVLLGLVSLCNHDEQPNVEVEIDTETLTYRLIAVRPLRRGEELLVDYGSDYWQE